MPPDPPFGCLFGAFRTMEYAYVARRTARERCPRRFASLLSASKSAFGAENPKIAGVGLQFVKYFSLSLGKAFSPIYNLHTPFWQATEFSNASNPSLSSESSSIRRRFKHYIHPASSPMYTLTFC